MSCQCYANRQKEQTCGILKDGYLYGCKRGKCNDGVGCTSYIDPYDKADTEPLTIANPLLWLIITVLIIISTVVTFTEA